MLSQFTLYLFPVLLLLGAAYDVASFRIPNGIPASLAAAFIPVALIAHVPLVMIGVSLLCGLAVLVAGMGLFAFKLFGGGDAKFMAAAALWVGFSELGMYLFYVGVVGGVFAIALMMFRRIPLPAVVAARGWIVRLHTSGQGIPYGVALAAAGIVVFPRTALFAHLVG